MVEFAGWEMPVHYTGTAQEHMAVRTRAGMFDVSHMGEIELKGPVAKENLQGLTSNDVGHLAVGQCQYNAGCLRIIFSFASTPQIRKRITTGSENTVAVLWR